MNTGITLNSTNPASDGRIQNENPTESDGLGTRFREILGDESVSSFARRCGVGESTLRNILNGALPRTDYLVAIANAGGVVVDWLATGRLPKTRSELRALQPGSITGPLMSAAISRSHPLTIDQLRALGIDNATFDAFLSGTQLPTRDFLMNFADITGCELPPLLAAHDRSITQNVIGAQNQHTPGEVELLTTYRNASEAGKSALNKVASAIRTQTMSAWFSAGMAVSEAANIFDKKK